MSTTATRAMPQAIAQRLTDWLDPKSWIIAVSLVTGWTSAAWSGLAWGAVSALFAAIIPVLIIKLGVNSGRWADRHLGATNHRLIVMPMILASVAVGLALMLTLSAPIKVVALTVAMFATLAGLAVITPARKISVHAAVAAGATTMLAIQLPAAAFAVLAVLVAAVAWSRVALRAHTTAQVAIGALLGSAIAGTLFTALS